MMRQFLNDLLDTVIEQGRRITGQLTATPMQLNYVPPMSELARDLISRKGDASGVAIATFLLEQYSVASLPEQLQFLRFIAEELGPDPIAVDKAVTDYLNSKSAHTLEQLHAVSEPRRQELLRRLNLAPGGTAALVKMREHLLETLPVDPSLQPLESDLLHLLGSWFNRGFLVLKRIDWTTPANILEKIIRYEAVHEIVDWNELRRRLLPSDRRCFAFFHPQLVDEPLIFVEVALTRQIPGAIGPLLSERQDTLNAAEANTAVFYSISNCQQGLSHISFGNFLIKQVVEELKAEVPSLTRFVTLSPAPGFRKWLDSSQQYEDLRKTACAVLEGAPIAGETATADIDQRLQLAATDYFLHAKNRSGKPLDPVARFHLGNGARLEAIHAAADLSTKGLQQSYGIMVNYLYDLAAITERHEAYAQDGKVAISDNVETLKTDLMDSRATAFEAG